ncbi:YjzD family protein [Bacillus sp. FJAT-27245]|uniref:YjzD family protein n=1 Tax=Bacillus sp. FJAT-27245 TaxID=1684144 RepID=UPI0006A76E1F|nr:YjzD family protein [Bacillus sp. FJAT-27245]
MRYFWTLFWVLLLVEMLAYVVTSMVGVAFDFKIAAVLGVLTTILILVVPSIIPNEPVDNH